MGRAVRRIAQQALTAAIITAAAAGIAAAQQPEPEVTPRTVNVEVDPIKCWWRTSTGAIRVGEPFSIVLTCAVVENDLHTVVPDQTPIEPAALQLPPFEVIGGTRLADRRTVDHRFFQYEYRARLIQEDAFGTDAALPELEIKYRIRTRTPDGASVDGREQVYVLPPVSVRVLSLVAENAGDIRDAPGGTFADLDALSFRANVLRLLGIVLFTLGAIMALHTLIRVSRQFFRSDAATRQLLPAGVVLRRAARELNAVKRQRAHDGWSSELVARALWALRIIAAYALARRTGQAVVPVTSDDPLSGEGHLVVEGGWLRDNKVRVSGAVTAASMGKALEAMSPGSARRRDLEALQTALARFGAVNYGRGDATIDESALDESLDGGLAAARRLSLRQLWPVKKFDAVTGRAAAFGRRVWSR